jgi:hypothetical protein
MGTIDRTKQKRNKGYTNMMMKNALTSMGHSAILRRGFTAIRTLAT